MSIREIAKTLYQLKKQVGDLERAFEAEPAGEDRDRLERELVKVRGDYRRMKKILEGEKDEPLSRRTR